MISRILTGVEAGNDLNSLWPKMRVLEAFLELTIMAHEHRPDRLLAVDPAFAA